MARTVFVIGAGASKEFGLPVGSELAKYIAEALDIKFHMGYHQTSGSVGVVDALRELARREKGGSDINEYIHKAWRVRDSLPLSPSIDAYLNSQEDEEMSIIGKLAIAECIIDAEKRSSLNTDLEIPNHDGGPQLPYASWLGEFLKIVYSNSNKREIKIILKGIGFIIFNYDRSFELFLFNSLIIYFRFSRDEAAEVVQDMLIYHPYGTVGSAPWITSHGLSSYGRALAGPHLLEAAYNIKIFSEPSSESENVARLEQVFDRCERVVFLGFAYHTQNLEILQQYARECMIGSVIGTAFGFSDNDVNEIKEDIKSTFNSDNIMDVYIENSDDCLNLLRKNTRWFSRYIP